MNIDAGISVATIANSATQVGDAVAIPVLRKALDAQGQAAMSLIQSVPQPTPVDKLPENLGRNLNVVA